MTETVTLTTFVRDGVLVLKSAHVSVGGTFNDGNYGNNKYQVALDVEVVEGVTVRADVIDQVIKATMQTARNHVEWQKAKTEALTEWRERLTSGRRLEPPELEELQHSLQADPYLAHDEIEKLSEFIPAIREKTAQAIEHDRIRLLNWREKAQTTPTFNPRWSAGYFALPRLEETMCNLTRDQIAALSDDDIEAILENRPVTFIDPAPVNEPGDQPSIDEDDLDL